jgi:hypothetical protein
MKTRVTGCRFFAILKTQQPAKRSTNSGGHPIVQKEDAESPA